LIENKIQFRAVCPPHKVRDLEQLVKAHKGDEESIRAQIQEWWDEPEIPVEPEWEQINKRKPKKILPGTGAGGSSVSPVNGGASSAKGGLDGRSSDKGTSGPRDGIGSRGRVAPSRKGAMSGRAPGARGAPRSLDGTQEEPPGEKDSEPLSNDPEDESSPISVAGIAGFVSAQDPTPSGEIAPVQQPKMTAAPATVTRNVWATKGSAHIIDAEKPKVPSVKEQMKPPAKASLRRPIVKEPQRSLIEVDESDSDAVLESKICFIPEENTRILPEAVVSPWGKALESTPSKEIDQASDNIASITENISSPLKQAKAILGPGPVAQETIAPSTIVHEMPAINMGRWEVSEGEQAHGLDFGFDPFGLEETEELTPSKAPLAPPLNHVVNEATSTNASEPTIPLSPARPPPGLGMATSGMPPMPVNAVLVHELEGKLERSSLEAAAKAEENVEVVVEANPVDVIPPASHQSVNASKAVNEKNLPSAARSQAMPPQHDIPSDIASLGGNSGMPSQGMPQHSAMSQNYPNYAPTMASMYNYGGNLGGAFVGIPTLGVIPPQQPQKIQQQGSQQPLQASGLYGSSASSGPMPSNEQAKLEESSELPVSSTSGSTGASLNAMGGPPGMHAGMPYNPALAFYGQQHAYAPQMGQPHGGVGYGAYGYGAAHQFGGAPSGYGYQQLAMGQSAGYGQPYDPQAAETQHLNIAQQSSHHAASSAYPKNTSGYRGRSSHHSQSPSHQYQNQYTPQHGLGYGAAQPYGAMGYSSMDHFQRTGYGPASGAMNNPYGMQQTSAYGQGIGPSSGISGFVGGQDDPNDRTHGAKGKAGKGSGIPRNPGSFPGNSSNVQQFQQVGAQGQPFGLQPGDHNSSANTAGWGNQSWGGPAWQQGGGN